MINKYCRCFKEPYEKPLSEVYELYLESTILQASSHEGSIDDPDNDGEGIITVSDFKSRNF